MHENLSAPRKSPSICNAVLFFKRTNEADEMWKSGSKPGDIEGLLYWLLPVLPRKPASCLSWSPDTSWVEESLGSELKSSENLLTSASLSKRPRSYTSILHPKGFPLIRFLSLYRYAWVDWSTAWSDENSSKNWES